MRTLRLTLSPPDGTFHPLDHELATCNGVVRESLIGLDWLSDGSAVVIYNLRADSEAAILDPIDGLDSVIAHDLTELDQTGYALFAHVTPDEPMSSLFELADRNALMIHRPITFTDDGIVLRVVGHESSLQTAITEIPDDVGMYIGRTSGHPPGEETIRTELTDRQREAIEYALELGYYESPRKVTCKEIANELDCVPRTANDLLRRAEGKLVSTVFEA